jgi:SpoVK/Ycf46/Vps4 family AAA+-type ATPase
MSVLETALEGVGGGHEPRRPIASLFRPRAPLVRGGLVQVCSDGRSAATTEVSVERALFDRLFPAPALTSEDPQGDSHEKPIEKIVPRFGLEGVVLPASVRTRLDEALAVPAASAGLASDWGLGEGLTSPAGVALLFYGPPGTGKTLTAEAVAGQLGRSLWTVRIDQLLSKYIGETEKAIAGVFRAAAEAGDVVLLDEADALLATRATAERRWEISQVNVLLKEIERFRGVVLLTTNRDQVLDPALERRLLSRIEFALPGEAERASIWKKHLPPRAPLAADVDLAALALKYPLSGSFIRTAAFFASLRASRRTDAAHVITHEDLTSAAAEQMDRVKEPGRIGFAHAPAGPSLAHPMTKPALKEMTP